MMNEQELKIALQNQIYAHALVQLLKAQGCAFAVISPGSRNTPLALALVETFPDDHIVALDERSAGFIALGYARESQKYAILCCTSGSALSHYLPALTEASYSTAPLLVLSADRPNRLQGVGAAQTINQKKIFGKYARFIQMPTFQGKQITLNLGVSLSSEPLHKSFKKINIFQVGIKQNIHINVPFEEPLWDEELNRYIPTIHAFSKMMVESQMLRYQQDHHQVEKKALAIEQSQREAFQKHIQQLKEIKHQPSVLIFLGAMLYPTAISVLDQIKSLQNIKNLSIIVYTEAASHLRAHPDLSGIELIYTDMMARWDQLPTQADLCIQIGTSTHSKYISKSIKKIKAIHLICADRREIPNPLSISAFVSQLKPDVLLGILVDHLRNFKIPEIPEAKPKEIAFNSAYAKAIDHQMHCWAGSIGCILNMINTDTAKDIALFVGNSMPYRLLDFTLNQSFARVWSARGTNGIDGNLSSVIGSALAYQQSQPKNQGVIAWMGDLTFLHDLQSLLTLNQSNIHNLLIIVSNNGGGGIFKYLSIERSKAFEHCFLTPQKCDLSSLMKAFAIDFSRCDSYESLRFEISEYFGFVAHHRINAPKIIEVVLDANEDYQHHQALIQELTNDFRKYFHHV